MPRTTQQLLPSPLAHDGRENGDGTPSYAQRRIEASRGTLTDFAVAELLSTPTATTYDTNQGGAAGRTGEVRPSLDTMAKMDMLPTPTSPLTPNGYGARGGRPGNGRQSAEGRTFAEHSRTSDLGPAVAWTYGDYGSAVARWAEVFAPPPATEVSPRGTVRLAAPFAEWMLGIPAGFVTDHVARNAALRIIGNGVMERQAVNAFGHLQALLDEPRFF